MSTKHILPPPEEFFDDDLPEMSRDEMIKMMKDLETKPPEKVSVINNVDLHLGPAQVKPSGPWAKDPHWWVKENMPNLNLEILALDVVIGILTCVMLWLIIDTWVWVFF